MNEFTQTILIFAAMQVLNVILSTIKSLVMIKGNRWGSIIANTLYYAFYSLVIKQISGIDNVWLILIITALANFFGTWLGYALLDKIKKDSLWIIEVVIKKEFIKDCKHDLNEAGLEYLGLQSTWAERESIKIYCYTKNDTSKAKPIIKKYNGKYNIQESKIVL